MTHFYNTTTAEDFLYASDKDANQVAVYQIAPTTGVLTLIQTYTPSFAADPNDIAFDSTGAFAYVADRDAGNLSQYTVSGTGALAPQSTPTVPMGTNSLPIQIVTSSKY